MTGPIPKSSQKYADPAYWTKRDRAKGKKVRRALFISGYVLLGFTGAIVIYLNLQPYIGGMLFLGQSIGEQPLADFLTSIPILGGALGGVGYAVGVVAGILLWATIQLFEILGMLLFGTPDTLELLIAGLQGAEQMEIDDDDLPVVKRLKRQFNDLPHKWMRDVSLLGLAAYIVDFWLCFTFYPPVEGGLEMFFKAGLASDIDWGNAVLMAVTMFAVEGIVGVGLFLGKMQRWFTVTEVKVER